MVFQVSQCMIFYASISGNSLAFRMLATGIKLKASKYKLIFTSATRQTLPLEPIVFYH